MGGWVRGKKGMNRLRKKRRKALSPWQMWYWEDAVQSFRQARSIWKYRRDCKYSTCVFIPEVHTLVCKNGAIAAFEQENQKWGANNGRKVGVGVLVVELMEWRKWEAQKEEGAFFILPIKKERLKREKKSWKSQKNEWWWETFSGGRQRRESSTWGKGRSLKRRGNRQPLVCERSQVH